ncbi:hypothetical protein LTS14_004389 [Recurvomyces mirabilis]|nr:hypothetical protein LTS14_004389 [Recurvomyces mirabilis]
MAKQIILYIRTEAATPVLETFHDHRYTWDNAGSTNPWAQGHSHDDQVDNNTSQLAAMAIQGHQTVQAIAQTPPFQARPFNRNGLRGTYSYNPATKVTSTVATEPVERITDPALLGRGIYAHRMLIGNPGETEERLYSTFKLRESPDRFFKVGRVFLVLWAEPAGESKTLITKREQNDRGMSTGNFGERVYSKVRRFVVIRAGKDYCSALPIATYGNKGVAKRSGVKKADHAIIYTGQTPPRPMESEAPQRGEQGMQPVAIRVVPDNPVDKLDPASRLDFGKIHTIQHNIKVRQLGMIHDNSIRALMQQFQRVWALQAAPPPTAGPSSNHVHEEADAGEGEDDDDDSQPDEGDSDDESKPRRTYSSPPTSPAAANTRTTAVPTSLQISQAQGVLTSFETLRRQGQTPAEALQILVQRFVKAQPRYSAESAKTFLLDRLQQARRATQESQTYSQGNVLRQRNDPAAARTVRVNEAGAGDEDDVSEAEDGDERGDDDESDDADDGAEHEAEASEDEHDDDNDDNDNDPE